MHEPKQNWILILLVLIAGCGDDAPTEIDTPPLLLRWTIPENGTQGHYETTGRTLIARFNRDVVPDEVATNLLIPAPISSGGISFDTPRQIEWYDVVLDPDVTTCTWLIDGPDFANPVIVEIHPTTRSDPVDIGKISGAIDVGTPRPHADDALIFIADSTADPDPGGQLTFFGRRVHRIARVDPIQSGANSYSVSGLDTTRTRRFLVLAIDDSDGDGRYHPGADWWGYPRDSLRPETPLYEIPYVNVDLDVRIRLGLEPPMPTNFEIVAPGRLSPRW